MCARIVWLPNFSLGVPGMTHYEQGRTPDSSRAETGFLQSLGATQSLLPSTLLCPPVLRPIHLPAVPYWYHHWYTLSSGHESGSSQRGLEEIGWALVELS